MEWQPIETAPRDGTIVLLYHKTHGIVEGWFGEGEWSEETLIAPREYSGSVWVLGDDLYQEEVEELPEGYHDGNISHWSVLPPPPSVDKD